MVLKVEIRRESDSEVRVHSPDPAWMQGKTAPSEVLLFLWKEGHCSCDCNRELFWRWADGQKDVEDTDCSDGRYSIRMTYGDEVLIDEWSEAA